MTRLTSGTLAVLLLVAAGFGYCAHARGAALAGERAAIAAAKQAQDALQAAWDAERRGLEHERDSLRQDSSRLAFRDWTARLARDSARDSLGRVLARIPDAGARAAAGRELGRILQAGEVCEEGRVNCEARVANAEQRARGDSIARAALRAFVDDTLEPAWRRAERRASKTCGLGFTAGVGLRDGGVLVGGSLVGLTCVGVRLFSPPWSR